VLLLRWYLNWDFGLDDEKLKFVLVVLIVLLGFVVLFV